MRNADLLQYAARVVRGGVVRTALVLLAMGIGVAAVVLVSALGEGARRYVAEQFGALGTNLVIVLPGRSETAGAGPAIASGETTRDITLDDALALSRSLAVRRLAPLIVGLGAVRAAEGADARVREGPVLGSTSDFLAVRNMTLSQGVFLPGGDPHHAAQVCVIGGTIAAELFGTQPPLGRWLRIGDRRFRVIGVLAKQGTSLGLDTDELVIVPIAAAQALFNTEGLFRVLVEAKQRDQVPQAKADAEAIMQQRHEGERDVTVITQDAVLATFDRILGTLTLAIGGLAAISLAVAGILVMNVMLISVAQRRSEIGLLKALGATAAEIRRIFFSEAVLLALGGAAAGVAVGLLGQQVLVAAFPNIPFAAPWWALVAAPLTAVVTAVVFTVMPARRAAKLDPVQALSRR